MPFCMRSSGSLIGPIGPLAEIELWTRVNPCLHLALRWSKIQHWRWSFHATPLHLLDLISTTAVLQHGVVSVKAERCFNANLNKPCIRQRSDGWWIFPSVENAERNMKFPAVSSIHNLGIQMVFCSIYQVHWQWDEIPIPSTCCFPDGICQTWRIKTGSYLMVLLGDRHPPIYPCDRDCSLWDSLTMNNT